MPAKRRKVVGRRVRVLFAVAADRGQGSLEVAAECLVGQVTAAAGWEGKRVSVFGDVGCQVVFDRWSNVRGSDDFAAMLGFRDVDALAVAVHDATLDRDESAVGAQSLCVEARSLRPISGRTTR